MYMIYMYTYTHIYIYIYIYIYTYVYVYTGGNPLASLPAMPTMPVLHPSALNPAVLMAHTHLSGTRYFSLV